MLRAWSFGVAAALLVSCVPFETYTTEVRMKEPSNVALESSTGSVVIAAKSGPTEGALASGRAETGKGSSASYDVRGLRAEDGSIAVEWKTTLPLANGERHVILPSDGVIVLPGRLSDTALDASLHGDKLQLRACSRIVRHSSRNVDSFEVQPQACVILVPYPPPPHPDDSGTAVARYTLSASRADVVVTERRDVDHAAAGLTMGAFSVLLGGSALLLGLLPPSKINGGATTQAAVCTGFLATAVIVDLALLPNLFAQSSDTVIER